MNFLKAAALSAFLSLSNCSHNIQHPRNIMQESRGMDLSQLFDKISDAQIVSFGEYHALDKSVYPFLDYQLETERFYKDIIPEMASNGFRDLVIEGLFSDISRDDLDYFRRNGIARRDSLLEYNLNEFPDPNILNMMKKCRDYDIAIHPGGISSTQFLSRIQLELESTNDRDAARAAALYYLNQLEVEIITENMKNQIELIAEQGKKVMSFSGIRHNNCNKDREPIYDEVFEAMTDERRELNVSFGSDLYSKYNRQYLEVDLIAPETLGSIEVNGRTERIVQERIPIEYMLLVASSRGRGIIRSQPDTENRLLIIFNETRNKIH